MIMNKNSKRYRGFGFVTFESYECVDYVFRDYNNHFIKGNWIECKASFPKNLNLEEGDVLDNYNNDDYIENDENSLDSENYVPNNLETNTNFDQKKYRNNYDNTIQTGPKQIKVSNKEWFENFRNLEQYFQDEDVYYNNSKTDNLGSELSKDSLINKSSAAKIQPINIQNMVTKTKDVLINEYPSVSRQQSAAPYQFPIIKQESKKLNKIADIFLEKNNIKCDNKIDHSKNFSENNNYYSDYVDISNKGHHSNHLPYSISTDNNNEQSSS